jgi:hypothetical protein
MNYLRQNEGLLYLDKKERVIMDKKTILSEIKKLITFSTEKFLDAKTMDGTIIRVEGDKFDVGMPLLIVSADGLLPSKAGEMTLEDGTRVIVDEAGIITAVEYPTQTPEAPLQASAENFADAKTLDGMNVRVEGDVAIGNKMLIEKEGEFVPAGEGQYNLEDGSVVYVDADGLINEIETPDTKETDETDEEDLEAVVKPEVAEKALDPEAENKMGDLEKRLTKIEEMINEMLPMMKQTADFGASVINKIDTFVADTPAQQQFASIKSEYSQLVKENMTNKFSNLENIKNVRQKQK